jgi:ADP-heptose:LPS heptosyltransferase
LTGSPADKDEIDEILEMMQEKAYNFAGKTTLKELAELYSRVECFIGGDTGPMHLAVAVERPVIALMGPTTPITHGPYGEGHIVIQKDIECKECWNRSCDDLRCMEEIEVEEVFRAARKMVGSEMKEYRDRKQIERGSLE